MGGQDEITPGPNSFWVGKAMNIHLFMTPTFS